MQAMLSAADQMSRAAERNERSAERLVRVAAGEGVDNSEVWRHGAMYLSKSMDRLVLERHRFWMLLFATIVVCAFGLGAGLMHWIDHH